MAIQSTAIFITGLPGTGKSTLAKRLSEELLIPVLAKDEIKELMFDSLGWSDWEWSGRLGSASFDLLYLLIAKMAAGGASFIVDAHFGRPELAREHLLRIQAAHPFRAFELSMVCSNDLAFERFASRATSGGRHPGHVDAENLDTMRSAFAVARHEPLNLGGPVRNIDVALWDAIPFRGIAEEIRHEITRFK